MNPDDFKHAWQSQLSGRRLVFDEEVILRQVQRNRRDFRGIIFQRDRLEIGGSVILAGVMIWHYTVSHFWPLLAMAATVAWIGGFMLVDRIRQNRRRPKRDDGVKSCLASAVAEVDHQIWLLRNIFWWYILPPMLACAIVTLDVVWPFEHWILALFGGCFGIIFGGVGIFCHWLNQRCIKKDLEPRRQELEALLQNLQA